MVNTPTLRNYLHFGSDSSDMSSGTICEGRELKIMDLGNLPGLPAYSIMASLVLVKINEKVFILTSFQRSSSSKILLNSCKLALSLQQ